MEKKKTAARRRAEWKTKPGDASQYIHQASDILKAGVPVILIARVSDWVQEKRDNLRNSVSNLRREMKSSFPDSPILDIHTHVGSGYDPMWLCEAANDAKKYGAILLAETPDRFVRHKNYGKSKQHLLPTEDDLEDLRWWTFGVPLATILQPNSTNAEMRGYQSRRGQQQKSRHGGRPKKKKASNGNRHGEAMRQKAFYLWCEGFSYRKIERRISVSKSTLQRWISDVSHSC